MTTSEAASLRVAVVGAGAFGRNHLRVYRELEQAGFPVELVAVIDPNEAARAAAEKQYGVRGFATIADCMAVARAELKRVDAASVCVPTVHHAACARELMACGIDLLIEKPLAGSLAEADEIVGLARELGRVVQVGHLERFNPAVRAVRGLLNRPMFFEVHRLSVFTPRSLDVDVGLEFENGCVANFTASRVSTERVRKMRFFQPHQYLSLDFARQDLLMIDVTAAAGLDMAQLAAMAALANAAGGSHPSAGMSLSKVPVEAGEPLLLEIEAFL